MAASCSMLALRHHDAAPGHQFGPTTFKCPPGILSSTVAPASDLQQCNMHPPQLNLAAYPLPSCPQTTLNVPPDVPSLWFHVYRHGFPHRGMPRLMALELKGNPLARGLRYPCRSCVLPTVAPTSTQKTPSVLCLID